MDSSMFFDGWYGLGRVLIVGIAAYVVLVFMLRMSGKRTLSKFNAFDFIITIALGSTLSSIVIGKSVALAEGILALGLLVALQFIITWLSVRSQGFQEMIKSTPALLVHRGVFQDQTMRDERVTREEVTAALHASGRAGMGPDCCVVLETDGTLNVFEAR